MLQDTWRCRKLLCGPPFVVMLLRSSIGSNKPAHACTVGSAFEVFPQNCLDLSVAHVQFSGRQHL